MEAATGDSDGKIADSESVELLIKADTFLLEGEKAVTVD